MADRRSEERVGDEESKTGPTSAERTVNPSTLGTCLGQEETNPSPHLTPPKEPLRD